MATDGDRFNQEYRKQWLTDFEERTDQIVLKLAMDEELDDKDIGKWIKDYLFLRSAEEEMNAEFADKKSGIKRRLIRVKTDFQTNLLTRELEQTGLASPVILAYLKREETIIDTNGLYSTRDITPSTLREQARQVGSRLTGSEAIYVVLDAITKKLESTANRDTLRSKWQKLLVRVTRV